MASFVEALFTVANYAKIKASKLKGELANMHDESKNEFIEALTMRKKFVNKVCGAIAGACALLFTICCLLPNTFLASTIVKALIGGVFITDLCWMLGTNISFDSAINDAKIAQIKKMFEEDDKEYATQKEDIVYKEKQTIKTQIDTSKPTKTSALPLEQEHTLE